ncbi:translation initiation factor IF-2-like [Hordeum vulgare subsp. vulgare]|uniref:SHSP domain-containing protein n=1 Tax=Hordeum vulgare subsp. vulgare TaxID=112509 RepID=A0A8I7BFH4_HORVV|nr:translation initiation factor IF-2-like [Hordeum vulgare subsp. vulgare]
MAAATNTKQKQQQQPPPPAGGQPVVVDPKFEWAEKAGGYVLRITLQGFKKGDFRVQVDGAGRLTVSGARPGTTPGSLHKVFQLPSTASLDDIAGRFEAGVLTLTVPKRAYSGVPAPTSVEEIKRDKPGVVKDDGAPSTPVVTPPANKDVAGEEKKAAGGMKSKEEIGKEEDVSKKAMDEAAMKAQQQKQPEEASKQKEEQQKLAPEPEAKKEQEVKPKAPQAAAPAAPEKPAQKPEVFNGEKAKAVVDQESLAAVVRRRSEEEKAKAAAAAMEAKAVLEKKATACGGWKERVAGGLEQLTDMKWADNVVEKARNNKEVIAIAIAAFSVGFFVSQKLFRK